MGEDQWCSWECSAARWGLWGALPMTLSGIKRAADSGVLYEWWFTIQSGRWVASCASHRLARNRLGRDWLHFWGWTIVEGAELQARVLSWVIWLDCCRKFQRFHIRSLLQALLRKVQQRAHVIPWETLQEVTIFWSPISQLSYNKSKESKQSSTCVFKLFGASLLSANLVSIGLFEVAVIGEVWNGLSWSIGEFDGQQLWS